MKLFFNSCSLKSLIRQPTYCKNFEKLTCIGLILTNMPRSFQSKSVIEIRLPDLHLMTLIVMRNKIQKK